MKARSRAPRRAATGLGTALLTAGLFTACSGEDETAERNDEAHAAAEAYAGDLATFAGEVAAAVEGWDPLEDDPAEVEALAEQAPTLEGHDDVDGTPLYLAATQAQATVATAVDELTLMTEFSFDGQEWSQYLVDMIDEELTRESDLSAEVSGAEGAEGAVQAWRAWAVDSRDLAEERREFAVGLYGEDRLSDSLTGFVAATSDQGLRDWDTVIGYFDEAESPRVQPFTGLARQIGGGYAVGRFVQEDYAGPQVAALSEQIQQAAEALETEDAEPGDVPRAGDAYRTMILDVLTELSEDAAEAGRSVDAARWMVWRITEVEELDQSAFDEAVATVDLVRTPAFEGQEQAPLGSSNYVAWTTVMNDQIAGGQTFDLFGDLTMEVPSAVEWARYVYEDRPAPPDLIAEDVLVLIERGEEYVAEIEALLAENPDPQFDAVEDLAEPMRQDVEALATQIAERLDDDEQMRTAIEEALTALE